MSTQALLVRGCSGDVSSYVDTGSYIFNGFYVVVRSLEVFLQTRSAIAGESSTGKTFFTLGVVRSFLNNNPEKSGCIYFESESVISTEAIEERTLILLV